MLLGCALLTLACSTHVLGKQLKKFAALGNRFNVDCGSFLNSSGGSQEFAEFYVCDYPNSFIRNMKLNFDHGFPFPHKIDNTLLSDVETNVVENHAIFSFPNISRSFESVYCCKMTSQDKKLMFQLKTFERGSLPSFKTDEIDILDKISINKKTNISCYTIGSDPCPVIVLKFYSQSVGMGNPVRNISRQLYDGYECAAIFEIDPFSIEEGNISYRCWTYDKGGERFEINMKVMLNYTEHSSGNFTQTFKDFFVGTSSGIYLDGIQMIFGCALIVLLVLFIYTFISCILCINKYIKRYNMEMENFRNSVKSL